jgi:pathogenesis-related protein 1
MHARYAVLMVAALCAGSVAGDAFVPMATATVGPDSVVSPRSSRGRSHLTQVSPARTMKLASETAAIEPTDYLEESNAWRAEVGAPPLVWDATIAGVAQAWADRLQQRGCDMEHSNAEWQMEQYGESLGENIAWACCDDPPSQDGKQVVDMWASEKKSYAYGPLGESCTSHDGGATGHYTQLVWANSQKMGCGMATCGDKGTVWVCNFFPAGNWEGEAPFCKANVPEDMPTCPNLGGGLGEGLPCDTPSTRKCGYEEKCCSCPEEGGDEGAEQEIEEGREDQAQGERDEEEGQEKHDEAEQEEGEDEERAGEIEEDRGEAEEKEYISNHEFHKIIEITGLEAAAFDDVKFQEAVAEVLGVPLFEVEVSAPEGHRRRLLEADAEAAPLLVPVTVKCDGRRQCKKLLGQLEGNVCNGGLARALSETFNVKIRTPGCKAYKTPLEPYDPRNPRQVTFPDAYPNSVRHWLLIGSLSLLLGSGIVFFFTFVPSRTPPMANVLVFISCACAMCAYYCMWAGVLVEFKTTDVTPRVIFYPKYLDWLVTCPLTLAAICLVAEAESALMVSLIGNAILMVLCGLVGSSIVAPYKYIWWVLGVAFLVIIVLILNRILRQNSARAVRNLVFLTAGLALNKQPSRVAEHAQAALLLLAAARRRSFHVSHLHARPTRLSVTSKSTRLRHASGGCACLNSRGNTGVWMVYPLVWVTGSEGTAALGLSQEVAVTCILDIIAKVLLLPLSLGLLRMPTTLGDAVRDRHCRLGFLTSEACIPLPPHPRRSSCPCPCPPFSFPPPFSVALSTDCVRADGGDKCPQNHLYLSEVLRHERWGSLHEGRG